jgi:hypothetical protein
MPRQLAVVVARSLVSLVLHTSAPYGDVDLRPG